MCPRVWGGLQDAAADFCKGIRTLGCYADYLVVNVSSPNTPGLRNLQRMAAMKEVITAAMAARDKVMAVKMDLLLPLFESSLDAFDAYPS